MTIKEGFTGTREEPKPPQKLWLLQHMLDEPPREWHHGCCKGSDAFSHRAAKNCDLKGPIKIHLHPPEDPKWEMDYDQWDFKSCMWSPKKPYLVRNKDIVDETDMLIALPKGEEDLRSGTWSTVRYALKIGKPVTICMPDGRAETII